MVFVLILLLAGCARDERQQRMSGAGLPDLRVGAAAVNFEADDSMILGGMFRLQREKLAPHRGEERETWLQVMLIGDVAIVGVPAEFFTKLGRDIKERSPFRYTFIAELANDWIGYLPDLEAHKLGGYQTWTGLHSYAEPGTGERVVEEAVKMLNELPKAN